MPSTLPGWIPRSAALLVCAWPLSLHVAILSGRADWAPAITLLAATFGLVLWALATRRPRAPFVAGGIVVLLALLVLLTPQVVLYTPSLLFNAALAVVFGMSLRPPRVPIITRFAQLEHLVLPLDLAVYTRRLTGVWTAFFIGMALISITLAASGSLDTWSAFSNIGNYVLVSILFVGEYVYRRRRFREYRHATLIELARNVRRAGLIADRTPAP